MIEKCGESLNSGGNFGGLLTELTKAFDCSSHYLLLVQLHAYELDMLSLKRLHSFLTKGDKRSK